MRRSWNVLVDVGSEQRPHRNVRDCSGGEEKTSAINHLKPLQDVLNGVERHV